MKRRIFSLLLLLCLLAQPASAADFIKWVEFDCSLEAMERALALDVQTKEQELHLSWIDLLALAAVYGGGKPTPAGVDRAVKVLAGPGPEESLRENYKYFLYYQEAYSAALGGLVGSYAIELQAEDGSRYWKPAYGLKAFSPIAAGYGYCHCSDFGAGRSYGFKRRHLGNDLMGSLGTPIVAVEGGTVEALGWNQYGGWRVGIRSRDRKRYYYYAHLQKDHPYPDGLKEGDEVQAGQVIGFMGRTGYSTHENVNNIQEVHLHFGLELIFDESQKDCNSEIWIDVYNIVRLLSRHRSSVVRDESGVWRRVYAYRDLDIEQAPGAESLPPQGLRLSINPRTVKIQGNP